MSIWDVLGAIGYVIMLFGVTWALIVAVACFLERRGKKR